MLSLTFPPIFFCLIGQNSSSSPNEDLLRQCIVKVEMEFQPYKEYKCNNIDITQVVIGFKKQKACASSCGLWFTWENWNRVQGVPVRAVLDSLRDKDQIRILEIHGSVPNMQTQVIGTVEVSKIPTPILQISKFPFPK